MFKQPLTGVTKVQNSFHYLAPDSKEMVSGIRPDINDLVSVTTFAGKGIVAAHVIDENSDGYQIRYPSADGLHVRHKTVPHHWRFEHSNKPLTTVAAAKFWHSGLVEINGGFVFQRWAELPIFINSWSELGLFKLLLIAHSTTGADNDFTQRTRILRDNRLLENLAEKAEFPVVRQAAARVLTER